MSKPFGMWYCCAISNLCQISSSHYVLCQNCVKYICNLALLWYIYQNCVKFVNQLLCQKYVKSICHCCAISKLCQICCQAALVSKVCQIHLIAWLYQNCVKFPALLMSIVCQIYLSFDTALIYQNCVKFDVNQFLCQKYVKSICHVILLGYIKTVSNFQVSLCQKYVKSFCHLTLFWYIKIVSNLLSTGSCVKSIHFIWNVTLVRYQNCQISRSPKVVCTILLPFHTGLIIKLLQICCHKINCTVSLPFEKLITSYFQVCVSANIV